MSEEEYDEKGSVSHQVAVSTAIELGMAAPRAGVVTGATQESENASLAHQARAGDREAFGRLYQRYAGMVHGILLARIPYGEVDDLVQDVFLQALARLDSLREAAAFGGWLATIARNRATDYHRRARPTVDVQNELVAPDRSTAEGRAVLRVIQSLPETYRETLVLRLVEGMTGPEIAALTGLTPGSVRVNLHRGMRLLREKLTGKGRP